MLTSIPRFAQVVSPDVGPRFVDYALYNRSGISVRVGQLSQVFVQPQKTTSAQAIVTTKIRQPFGYATAFAGLITTASEYPLRFDGRRQHATASAGILGTAPKTSFGFVL